MHRRSHVTGCHHYNLTYSLLLSYSTASLILPWYNYCKCPLTLNSKCYYFVVCVRYRRNKVNVHCIISWWASVSYSTRVARRFTVPLNQIDCAKLLFFLNEPCVYYLYCIASCNCDYIFVLSELFLFTHRVVNFDIRGHAGREGVVTPITFWKFCKVTSAITCFLSIIYNRNCCKNSFNLFEWTWFTHFVCLCSLDYNAIIKKIFMRCNTVNFNFLQHL